MVGCVLAVEIIAAETQGVKIKSWWSISIQAWKDRWKSIENQTWTMGTSHTAFRFPPSMDVADMKKSKPDDNQ